MKKLFSRGLAGLLCLLLALTLLPCGAFARDAEPERVREQSLSAHWINPGFEGLISEQELEEELSARAVSEAQSNELRPQATYTSLEDAGLAMRRALKDRESSLSLSLRLSAPLFNDDLMTIFEFAVEHTGAPTEGDYLHFNLVGWGADGSGGWDDGEASYKYTLNYQFSQCTSKAQEQELNSAVDTLLKELSLNGKSELGKIVAIYSYICENITYDYEHVDDPDHWLCHSAYAALIDKTAVCQGYATLLYRLLLSVGVDTRVIVSTDHAWNIIRVGDWYYNADSTWDAGQEEYTWLLCGSEHFPNHPAEPEYCAEAFVSRYPIWFSDCSAEGQPLPLICQCGEKMVWQLRVDHSLTVLGEGESYDYSGEINPLQRFANYVESVSVAEGVTGLNDFFFQECDTKKLELPESLKSIGSFCFTNNTMLESVELPAGIESLGDSAFRGCNQLREIELPGSLKELGTGCFDGCFRLERAVLGEGILAVPDSLFNGCYALEEVSLPSTLESIGDYAFANCALRSVELPEGLKSIDSCAFDGCRSLSELKLPQSLSFLGIFAFRSCAITEIELPEGLSAVEYGCFQGCPNLASVKLPATIKEINDTAFSGCTALETLELSEGLESIDSAAFANCPKLKLEKLPDSVTYIGASAFSECSSLALTELPRSLVTVDSYAFYYCTTLEELTVPPTVTMLAENCFSYCSGLRTLRFEGSAPGFGDPLFTNVELNAYYPANDPSWTEAVRQQYGGTVTWIPYEPEITSVPGDANGDGKVNGKDAVMLAQYLAGWDVSLDTDAMDVNNDGKLNGIDAVMLAQYLAGWEIVLR